MNSNHRAFLTFYPLVTGPVHACGISTHTTLYPYQSLKLIEQINCHLKNYLINWASTKSSFYQFQFFYQLYCLKTNVQAYWKHKRLHPVTVYGNCFQPIITSLTIWYRYNYWTLIWHQDTEINMIIILSHCHTSKWQITSLHVYLRTNASFTMSLI